MELQAVFQFAADKAASDIFIVAGAPITVKAYGRPNPLGEPLTAEQSEIAVQSLYTLADRDMTRLQNTGDDDFGLEIKDVTRFRVSAYRQKNSYAATMRLIPNHLPNAQKLGIPQCVMDLATRQKGLVLVTGTTGSGKSTTLACVLDAINQNRTGHIITIEDPIEYVHPHGKSVVSQREIERDTETYLTALRACLRQAPDVILVGEMRDYETISVALTAAETGHLVFSTLHTIGAASTIDRIIDVFPGDRQNQIRSQTSMVLQSVISQQLVPTVDGKLVAAYEIMHCNNAVRNLIREGKTHQLDNIISLSANEGMIGMDTSLLNLYTSGRITAENAIRYAVMPDMMRRRLAPGGISH
ncbi:MAG: PilT/PilU family type 4a pilus ATPase [Ruthenibacterium sp.]